LATADGRFPFWHHCRVIVHRTTGIVLPACSFSFAQESAMAASDKKLNAKLILPEGKETTLPVIVGTEDEHAIDIRSLRNDTGFITLDSGFMNTGSTTSAITYLDGEQGILRYRGYPIEELAEQSDFVETSYLLINGKLPTTAERKYFSTMLTRHSLIHEDMHQCPRW
jgi:citrate synthase